MAWFRAALCCECDPDCGQQNAEPGHEAAEVVASGGKHGVDGVAGLAGEVIAAHSVFGFGVADERLNRRSAPHLAFDRIGHPALLAGSKDLEEVFGWRVVALVTGVAKDALKRDAGLRLDLG